MALYPNSQRNNYFVRALQGRGDVYCLLGMYKEAMGDYQTLRKFKEYRIYGDKGISEVFEKIGKYKLAFRFIEDAYNNCFDKNEKIEILNQMLFLLLRLGNLKKAEKIITCINKLIEKVRDDRGELYLTIARSFYNFAIFCYQTGKYERAIDFVKKSMHIANAINERRRLALSYNLMGVLYRKISQPELSLRYYKKSLNLFAQIGDIAQIAGVYNNIGSVLDEPNDALKYYTKAFEIFKSIGYKMGIVESIHNIANCYLEAGFCKKALDEYNKSYTFSNMMSYPFGISISLTGVAKSYFYMGRYYKALAYLFKALKLSKKINDREGVLENYYLIAKIKIERLDSDTYKWLVKAKKLALNLPNYSFLVEILFDEFKFLHHKKAEGKILKLKPIINTLIKKDLKQRHKIFLKIMSVNIKFNYANQQDKYLIEQLENLLNSIKDYELIFEIGKTLINIYLTYDIKKALSVYSRICKLLNGCEMDVYRLELQFLKAKLDYYRDYNCMNTLRRVIALSKKIGNKRLYEEIKTWLKK
ncbi:MAG: tetratricopeptide repeat protein [candidate division WOR-3 bacterium]